MTASSFRVVLVGPENPRNVGFTARAMLCFGVSDLAIVGVPWTSPPAEARKTGAAALDILDRARVAPSLRDALRGCDTAVAFSRRPTVLRQTEFSLPAAPALPGRTALVFGRESNGLTREESALCPYLARIPCAEGLSLNLGQAAAIALFSLTAPAPAAGSNQERAVASVDRMLGLWDFLEPRLTAAPRFTAGRLQRIRQMLYRLRLDDEDFDLLFAVMSELSAPAAQRKSARRSPEVPK
ncbi:MAG: RNA methyltransferase [Elusimicrobia bacterium]|nr:RNA methyltransferase [Elusimicrobiota bacterium]MDE2509986.1 RNA methyltransferase [Elusimicrobiota bacterium]